MLARGLWIALSVAAGGLAAAPEARAQAYPVYTYEERDGLPSGVVFDVAQESSGRMWFATRAGLVSFDGRAWRVERPAAAGPPLSRLVIDDQDRVWAATYLLEAGLLTRERGGEWTAVPAPPDGRGQILELEPVRHGVLRGMVVGTREHGLFECWPDGWRVIELPPGISSVLDFEQRGEHLLIATGAGLWVRTVGSWRRIELDAPESLICALAPVGERELDPLWIVGRSWLGLLQRERFTLVLEAHNVFSQGLQPYRSDVGAIPALGDGQGGLWFGQPQRLAHFDRHTGELRHQGVSTGLVANGANALYRDLDGNTWIATHRGITRVSSQRFLSYDRSSGFFADEVNSILEHPSGLMIFGHPGGLTFFERESKAICTWALPVSPEEADTTPALDLDVDREGNLWIAAYTLGVISLTPAGEPLDVPDDVARIRAQTVRFDRDGRLWIGAGNGLFRWDGRELERPPEVPFQGAVRRICTLDGGRLALATMGFGAWIETEDGWLALASRDGTSAKEVYAVYRGPDRRLWVGAADGLFSEEGGELVRHPLGDEEMDEPVYSINADAHGRYWFGTQRGVVSWDGVEARRYGVHQGLAGLETNRAANLMDSTGALWFGTIDGVSRYSPADDCVSEGRAPTVELLGIDVEGGLRPLDRPATLGHEVNDPAFRFRAISFNEAGGVEYRYRLEGFDPSWVTVGVASDEVARYADLPAGDYRFAVQARIPGGAWGPEACSQAIRILQPFWLGGWFLSGAILAMGGMGFALWRLVFERRNSRRLKLEVEQRTAELVCSQKLESLGLLAGGVAHDFNNLLTAIMAHCELARGGAPADAAAHLDSIDGAAERGAGLTKALLGYARRQESSPRPLCLNENLGAMQAMLRPLIRSEIDLHLDLAPSLDTAFLDPSQLEQVVMNLVVNAIDAMPTGGALAIATENIELEQPLAIAHGDCVPAGRWVRLSVRDTGVGMDENTSARLFDPFFTTKPPGRGTGLGLATCHGIVKQNAGFVDFETAAGRGTTFSVFFPAMHAERTCELIPVAAESGSSLSGACILVVEDDAMVRPTLSRTLHGAGCHVLSAESAEEALRVSRDHPGAIDLLISDVIMPGLTGPALREQLLRERPRLRALFISGYTADVLSDREPTLSPVELLQKPFRGEELAARAALLLAQRPSGAASS